MSEILYPFSKSWHSEKALDYIRNCLNSGRTAGDKYYTKQCNEKIKQIWGVSRCLLTSSATSALEMMTLVLDIKPGDEVIMPSFTFSSTATAFALRGAKIIFVDVEKGTMNLDPILAAEAVNSKTRAIVCMHYAGVACDMERLQEIINTYPKISLLEDAAQGVEAFFKEQRLGTIGRMGCYSFHETKNISCGEGGLFMCSRDEDLTSAEIFREKGTNRSRFFRGEVDKYTWEGLGSSYLLSDINSAILLDQLNHINELQSHRMTLWNRYYSNLGNLDKSERIQRPFIPDYAKHNAHIFYFKTKSLEERSALIQFLRTYGVYATFHYIPLHSSPAGKKYGEMFGTDKYTTTESEKLVRLPLYHQLTLQNVDCISQLITDFYN